MTLENNSLENDDIDDLLEGLIQEKTKCLHVLLALWAARGALEQIYPLKPSAYNEAKSHLYAAIDAVGRLAYGEEEGLTTALQILSKSFRDYADSR